MAAVMVGGERASEQLRAGQSRGATLDDGFRQRFDYARGVGGELFLHQIVRTRAGDVGAYLDALGGDGVAAIEGEGAQLVGAYRVCNYDHEAIVITAFRTPRELARFQSAWHGGSAGGALRRWRAREDAWVRGKDTLLMKPRWFLSSPWHP